jgi:tripartite-type tricarboxylate transporter receptor subunit TctC
MKKEWKMRNLGPLFGFLLLVIPALAFTQEFPTKPINVLVSFPPGGEGDILPRLLASKAEKFLGQPLIISNRGGGGGSVALGIVAKEKPDGYHLVSCASTALVRVPQFRTVTYKLEDFVPIMHYVTPQSGLTVRADSPWKTFKEFIEYAKKNPGKVTYTTTGTGTPQHLSMEYIAKKEEIQWTNVPSPGGLSHTSLLGGHVTACSGGTTFIPHVRAGMLRLLATHGEKRMKSFPDVPTLRELGYDFINETVFLFAAPKGVPPSIVKKLDDTLREAMDNPEFLQAADKFEYEVSYRNSEETKRYLEEAYVRVGKMIIELKIPREEEKK